MKIATPVVTADIIISPVLISALLKWTISMMELYVVRCSVAEELIYCYQDIDLFFWNTTSLPAGEQIMHGSLGNDQIDLIALNILECQGSLADLAIQQLRR